MTYTYRITEWIEGQYRISVDFDDRKSAWANFDCTGSLIAENSENIAFHPFPSELKEKASSIIANLPENKFAGKDVFIRFNHIPKNGKSTNWATGHQELGVSAYEALYDVASGEYCCYGALEGAELSYLIQASPIYFITGEVVGKGSDGEPVISNIEVLGEATYNKITGKYF